MDYNAILTATSRLFHDSNPTTEECAVLGIIDLGIQIPQTRSEIFGHSELVGDDTVTRAVPTKNSVLVYS